MRKITSRYWLITLVVLSLIIIGLGGNILNKRIKTLPPPDQPTSSIVKFSDSDTKSAFLKANNLQASDLKPIPELANAYVVEKTAKVLVDAGANVSPQHAYRALMIPNDPIYPQWYTDKISAPAAWDITTGSDSVKIAIIDTGFGLAHEDLVGRWAAGGKDFVHNDNDPSAGTSNPTAAAVDHGTETAGLIGATGNNGRGVASTAWGVTILPLQVLNDNGYGTTASVAAAIHYAVDQGAKVINMSLGSSDPDPVIETELNYAQAHDVVLVAAAGNCGDPSFFINGCNRIGQVLYPAAYSSVIAVGAVDSNDNRAGFSSYGPELDITAPGSGTIQTTDWSTGNRTSLYSPGVYGTSFAAPIVAGAIGLMRSVQTDKSASEITSMLLSRTDKPAGMLNQNRTDNYGFGRLNAYWAVGSPIHPDGTLIYNASGTGVEVIQDGKVSPITSPAIFSSHNYRWSNIKSPTLGDNHLTSTTALAFAEGALLESQGRVYVVDVDSSGTVQKRWISSWSTFVDLGYKTSELLNISLDALPVQNGTDIVSPGSHPDGTIIYSANRSAVELIQNGQKRHIASPNVFNSYGYQWGQIKEPNTNDNNLPVGTDLNTFAEGTLISFQGHIYAVDITPSGVVQKRGISSWNTFVSLGYSLNEAINVSSAELPSEDGQSIL